MFCTETNLCIESTDARCRAVGSSGSITPRISDVRERSNGRLDTGAWIDVETGLDEPQVSTNALRTQRDTTTVRFRHLFPTDRYEAMSAGSRPATSRAVHAVPEVARRLGHNVPGLLPFALRYLHARHLDPQGRFHAFVGILVPLSARLLQTPLGLRHVDIVGALGIVG